MFAALTMTVMMLCGAPGKKAQAADPAADKAAVHQAALDYVDALYEADPAKVERSVHPSLSKRGFMKRPSIKKVEVMEVLDQTAVAKITAQWGIDYMQLAKFDGQWKIVNIVWQTHPVNR